MASIRRAIKRSTLRLSSRNLLPSMDDSWSTELNNACLAGDFNHATQLVKDGADVSIKDKHSWTPLHCAAQFGGLDLCTFLIERGSDPNATNDSRTSALHYLVRHEYPDIEKFSQLLQLMLIKGLNIDSKDKFDETPLHHACARGKLEAATKLLDFRADINAQNKMGETPLHKACNIGYSNVVKALVSRGARTDLLAENQSTCYDVAKTNGHTEVMSLLEKPKAEEEPLNMIISQRHDHLASLKLMETLVNSATSSPRSRRSIDFEEDKDALRTSSTLKIRSVSISSPRQNRHTNCEKCYGLQMTKMATSVEWFSHDENICKVDDIPRYYHANFFYKEHTLFVGKILMENKAEPFVLAVKTRVNDGKHMGLFRHKNLEDIVYFPKDMVRNIRERAFLNAIRDIITTKLKLKKKFKLMLNSVHSDVEYISNKMVQYEALDPQKPSNLSVGVLYCKAGQTEEGEMFGNVESSQEFEHFLHILGDKVELEGFTGYRGDLDVKRTHSVYTKWRDFEIMYHVSTLLPYTPNDPQQVYIIVTRYLQLEPGAVWPISIKNVYFLVMPVVMNGVTFYRVGCTRRDGVSRFGPEIMENSLFESGEDFRNLLLTKVVNGNLATLRAPFFTNLFAKTKESFLDDIVDRYI